MATFLFCGSLAYHLLLRMENAKRRSGKRNKWVEGLSREEVDTLGDKRPDFLYTL
jgi:hypothetical protein